MTEIDFTDLAQGVRKRLDELFPDQNGAFAGVGGPKAGPSRTLSKAVKIAATLQWQIPRNAVMELAAELGRIQPHFASDQRVAVLIKVQLELCRFIAGRRAGIPPQAPMLLLKGFEAMMHVATDPHMTKAAKDRAARAVLDDYADLKRRLSAPRKGDEAAVRLEGAPAAKVVERRPRAAAPEGAGTEDVLKNRAYYLVPVTHLEELTRFIKKEVEELHAAIAELSPGSR